MFGYGDEYEMDRCATEAEADAEYVFNVGADYPERAWILSNRDVWYRNPAYVGPAVPHPEDEPYEDADVTSSVTSNREAIWFQPVRLVCSNSLIDSLIDDEIPF